MSKSKRTSRFHMERLEDRQMMAGDVTAYVQNGTLYVKEASGHVGAAQAVQVSELNNGSIRVQGAFSSTGGAKTKVNGKDFVDFPIAVWKDISINLGGGSDQLTVHDISGFSLFVDVAGPGGNDNDTVTMNRVFTRGRVSITMGDGVDNLVLQTVQVGNNAGGDDESLHINTGVRSPAVNADRDNVTILGSTVFGSTEISTGANADFVAVRNSTLGDSAFDPTTINTGTGADIVELGSRPGLVEGVGLAGNLFITAGTDAEVDVDKVKLVDVFGDHNIVMHLGAGDDQLDMVNVQARNDYVLYGEKGNDTMRLTQVEAFEDFFALMGEGSDTLDITFVKAQKVQLDGGDGDGYDKLFLYQSPNIPTLIKTGFEEINGQKLIKKVTVANGGLTFARA